MEIQHTFYSSICERRLKMESLVNVSMGKDYDPIFSLLWETFLFVIDRLETVSKYF